jgi:hypothetical protein
VTPTPRDLERAILATDRIDLFTGHIRSKPVRDPFLDVAVHVIKAPAIRQRPPYVKGHHGLSRIGSRVFRLASILVKRPREAVPPEIARGRSSARGILPLCLCGKSVSESFLLRKPGCEGNGLVPRDEDDCFVVVLRKSKLAAKPCVRGIELLVLGVRYLVGAHVEGARNRDCVTRGLVQIPVLAPHPESPRRNLDQLHPE